MIFPITVDFIRLLNIEKISEVERTKIQNRMLKVDGNTLSPLDSMALTSSYFHQLIETIPTYEARPNATPYYEEEIIINTGV